MKRANIVTPPDDSDLGGEHHAGPWILTAMIILIIALSGYLIKTYVIDSRDTTGDEATHHGGLHTLR